MTHTPDKLKAFISNDLSYELLLFRSTSIRYIRDGAAIAAAGLPDADALLESVLTRLRALDSFYGLGRAKATDALAEDICDDWTRARVITGKGMRRAINTRLEHLVYGRSANFDWPIGEMVHRGLEVTSAFLKQAKRSALKPALVEIERALAGWTPSDQRTWTSPDRHAYVRDTTPST